MDRIAVVTDSASNLPESVLCRYGLTVVPIYLRLNGHVYRDGVDIAPAEVYQRMREGTVLPRTAAPSVGDFLSTYLRLSAEAEHIVSIHLSAKLSATIESARVAAGLAAPQTEVCVIDARTAAMGAGFAALEAARVASQGADLETVVRAAHQVSTKVSVYIVFDTLAYLYRGGRIGRAASLIGMALQIKPVIYLNDGMVDVLAKPRTRSRATAVMLSKLAQAVDGRAIHVAVMHADAAAEVEPLRKQIEARFHCVEVLTTSFTPVMGAHTGPGVLGVAFYPQE